MKKTILLFTLCCLYASIAHAQTVLFQAVPSTKTPTTFSLTRAANVSAGAPKFSGFTDNTTNPCSFAPSRTVSETRTVYENAMASSGNKMSFNIYPSNNNNKLLISSLGFKISSSNPNLRYNVHFRISTMTAAGSSYYDTVLVPTPSVTCNSSINSSTTERLINFPGWMLGTNIIDYINRMEVIIVFFGTSTAADVRVSSVKVYGCVLPASATTDCMGKTVQTGYHTGTAFPYSKYQLVYADEFDSTAYNKNEWVLRASGGFGGLMRDSNAQVYNGLLHLKYTWDTVPSSSVAGKTDTAFVGSGLQNTKNIKYGYYEFKTKLYKGVKGLHQSIWAVGSVSNNAQISAETNSSVNTYQNQLFEQDSYSSDLQPSIWTVKGGHYDYNNSRLKGPSDDNAVDNFNYRTDGPTDLGFHAISHIKDITVDSFFTCGVEIMPDSIRYYFNGKLRLSYPFGYPYNRDVMGMSMQISALPTPSGYYGTAVPLPPVGAEMTVDYMRYYAPKSCLGLNFLSNFTFGDPWVMDTSYIQSPNGWVEPKTKDLLGNTVSYNPDASYQDSTQYVPDAANKYKIAPNRWALVHKLASAAYKVTTRQRLDLIPNGNYEFSAYVKGSNKPGDRVVLRVKTRTAGNLADTVYEASANLGSNVADVNWRKVKIANVPVIDNNAVVEFLSDAAAGSYTYFDSALFIGVGDTLFTVSKQGCVGGSIKLTTDKLIPDSTNYQWQVSSFSSNQYNAWANLSNGATTVGSTNGFGATYSNVTKDSLVIGTIPAALQKARFRCLMTTPATSTSVAYVRYGNTYQLDAINNALVVTPTVFTPVYLTGTLKLDVTASGGSGTISSYAWTGPTNFSDTNKVAFLPKISAAQNGTYVATVTDNQGCYLSNSIVVTAQAAPENPVTVVAAAPSMVASYSSLTLTATVTGGSGNYSYLWRGPNGFSATTLNATINAFNAANSGNYTIMVTDLANNFIASDTETVGVTKRPQTINFRNIPNLSTYSTTTTTIPLAATASSGLPVYFQSSNTYLFSFLNDTLGAVQRANPDYSYTLLNPITTSKIRIYTTQSSHFHIREFRAFGVESSDYPTDVLENVLDSLPNGLVNLAADPNTTISASGQYAIGTTYWPENAVDGLVNTSWVSQTSTTSPAEKWLQLDFGSNKTVGNIQFVNGYQNSNGTWAGLMDNNLLRVQYWDGSAWQNITDCKVNITAVQDGDDNNLPVSVVQQLCINTSTKTVTRNTLPPSIVMPTIAFITNATAVVGATVMDSSGVSLTAKGVIIDTFPSPTTSVSHTNNLSGTYTQTLTGLKGNTQYYFKGFATNSAGTSYTQDTGFITLPNAPTLSFTNITTIGYCVGFLQSQAGNQPFTTEFQISTQADFQANLQSYSFTGSSGNKCFNSLTSNSLYYIRARSTNAIGSGAWATGTVTTLPLPTAILDGVAAPTSAFSTRMLRSAYNQKVVRVRRDNDSSFADVYFDAKQTISLSSPISFSGNTPMDSTLGAWLGNNSAFVSVWYDQSGNNNHAYKNTAHILRTGTVTITNGSNTLTGSGTTFSTTNTPVGGILTTATGRVIGRVSTINSTTSITLATAANFSQSGIGYGLLRQPRLADRGVLDTLENGRTAIRFFQGANSGTNLQHPTFQNDSGYSNMTNMRHVHLFAVVKQENTFNFAGIFNTTGVNSGASAPSNRFQFQMLTNSTTRNSFFNGVSGPNSNNNIRATAFTMNGVMNARFKMTTLAGVTTASIPIATSVTPSTATNFLSVGNFNGDSIQLFGHLATTTNMFEGIASELVFYGSTIASPITESQASNLFTNQSQTFGVLSITNPTVTNVQPNDVILGATVFRSASATISSRGTVYDTVAQPRSNPLGINGDYSGTFTQARTGLVANTQYYFRGFITTGSDTSFTPDSSFITFPLAPSIKAVASITTNSAIAQFGFSGSMGRVPYTFSLQIGSTNAFNTSDTLTFQNLSDSSYPLTNLLPNTTYYYRVLIRNATGNSAWSATQSFATLVALPTINAPTVTSITANSAVLGATVVQNGGQVLSARGTVCALTSTPTSNSLAEGNTSVGTFTHTRNSLSSNTRYYFRGFATNSAGTAYTNDSSFVTLPEQCIVIATNAITPISFTPRWTPSIGNADYTSTIQVSLVADFNSLVYNLSGIAASKSSYLITSLSPSTTYYYRIRLENQTGVGAWSAVQTVVTSAIPVSSLDNSGNPLFAYSVRLLRSSYTGPALRVRRDNTCDSVDVYFDGNQRVSLSSPISANGGGAATGNTLGDWVGNNSAFVTIWYDQSGNGKHTTTSTLNRTGTITVSAGSTSVTGTSTLFTTNTQLVAGNALYGQSGQIIGHVESIISATSLTLTGGAKNSVTNNTLYIQRLPRLVNKGVLDTLPSGIASLRISDGANGGLYATGLITPATSLQNMKFVNVFVAQRQLANTSNKVGLLNTASANSSAPTTKLQFNLEPSSSNSYYRGVSSASTPTSPTFGNTVQACGRLKVSVYASGANAQVASSFQALSTPTNNFLGTNNASVFDNTSVRIFGNLGLNSNCFDGLASEMVLYASSTDSLVETVAVNYLVDQTNYFGVLSVTKPSVTSITATSATLGATISTNSNATITARGTVYGTTTKPTTNALAEVATSIGTYSHTRTGLTANTLYYYRGYVTNSLGTFYSEDSVFTTLPNAPVIAPATNNTTSGFTANWTAPSGGNVAFTYTLQYSTTSNFSSGNTVVANLSSTSTVLTGLTPNTNYYYRVQCVNMSGNSAWSATQSTATLSNAPIVAAATTVTTTSFTANWTAPVSQGNATITYNLVYGTTSDLSLGTTAISNINALSNVVNGMVGNTNYYYQVVAVNSGGNSIASAIQAVLTNAAAPTIAAATNITSSSFTANWTAPTGGNATFTYTLQYSTTADFSSGNSSVTAISSAVNSVSVTGLLPNTTLYYRVQAVNATGSSAWSAVQSLVTLSNVPTGLTASAITATGFTVNWTAPANQGAANYTYTLQYATTSDFSSSVTTIASISGTAINQALTGLTANTSYYIRIAVLNATGLGNYSATLTATTLPLAPTIAAATNIVSTSFTGNWTAPTGGNATFTYTLQYSTTADFSLDNSTVSGIATLNNVVSSLTANTNYYYRVAAVNSGGTGDWSAIQSVLLLPNAPIGLIASNISTTGCTIGWTAPANQGASAFTYSLQYSTAADFSAGNTTVANIATLNTVISGLTANTNYYFRVMSVNATGNSAYTATTTIATLSLPPTSTAASAITIVGFTANWTAPISQGGAAYTYTLQYSTAANFSSGITTVSGIASSALSTAVSGLGSNVTYYYRVQVVNQGGASAWSSTQTLVTSQPISGILDNLNAQPTFAYSVRQLRTAYTGPALRIRKDNATNDSVDVYFDAKQRVSLTSPVSAVLSGAGIGAATSTTLAAFVGTNSAFVTIWYDQSGNGRNAFSNAAVTTKSSSTISTTSGSRIATVTGLANTSFTSSATATTNSTTVTTTSSSNSTIRTGYSIVGNGVPANTVVTGFSGNPIVISMSNAASIPASTTLTISNVSPGNLLSNTTGQVIGVVDSLYSNNTTTIALKSAATTTLSSSAYGFVSQPRLINAGVLDTLANGMPSLRMMNGVFNGAPLAITNFTNDGGGTNLQGMKYFNVFVTAQQLGNLNNDNGLLNSGAVGTGVTNRFQFNLSRSGTNSIYKSLTTGNTTAQAASFSQGLLAAARLRTFIVSNTDSAYIYTSFNANTGVKDFLGASNATVLDATQPQIFGYTGFVNTFYEGNCPELLFYGSTSTAINEADATAIITDQTNVYGILSVRKPTVTSITATSATLGATISTNSNATITARGTVYGTTAKPTTNALAEGSTTIGTYTHTRDTLVPNTPYYYRGYVTNGLGTFYSEDSTFLTMPATPTIAAATNIATNGFTANWTAPTGGNASFSYSLQYSTTADFSASVTTITSISSSVTANDLTGLASNTVYYYRVATLNGTGQSAWSSGQQVTTLSNAPVFAAATNVCTDIATINWTAPTNQGGASYTYTLQYSPTANFSASVTTLTNIQPAALSQALTNLTANTTYYYRIAAVNNGGASAYGVTSLATATNHQWTGASSTVWNDAGNWCGNILPTSSVNVAIPNGLSNYPVLTTSGAVRNLSITANAVFTVTGTLQVSGSINNSGTLDLSAATLEMNGSIAQSIPSGGFVGKAVKNLIVNNNAGVDLADTLKIIGTLSPTAGVLNTNNKLILTSTAANTARIAAGTGNYLNGAVTVERFIPSKTTRKYAFIAATTNQSIRNGWQNQIFITGPGTGGLTCGIGVNYGGSSDKYNSNGFDKTQVNAPSMFTYNPTPGSNGSRWVTIASTTNTNLEPGKGYRVNIRGDRNVGTCADQLNSNTPTAPVAVTLQSTGTVSTGNVAVTLNNPATHLYTLLGNPYPSQISFTSLLSSNTSNISNKMWTYSPYGNGNYTTYSNGLIANAATGYDNTNGDLIASGQSFFVEAKPTGSGTVTFQESHKASGTIPNTQYFGTANQQLIRIGLKTSSDSSLDEAIVRFNGMGAKTYVADWDAATFGGAAQNIAIQKGSSRLAIATLPLTNSTDSILLTIKSNANGSFQLNFNDLAGLDSNKTYWLRDTYLNQSQNIRNSSSYVFNITADSLSKGDSRFLLIAKPSGTTLPVRFVALTAKATDRREALVAWTVGDAKDVVAYVVERSSNGVAFAPIASVKATASNQYSIKDAQLPENAEMVYYRIQLVELNGQKAYSQVVQLITHHSPQISIYPNPAKGAFTVQLPSVATQQRYNITVYSVDGKAVRTEQNLAPTEANALRLTTNGLAIGVYQLKVQGRDGTVWTVRLQVEE